MTRAPLALFSCALAACGGAPSSERGLSHLLQARDIDGRALARAAPAEGPTVVLFFATWCEPCRREIALLGELRARDASLFVLGVNAYETYDDRSDDERLRAFLASEAPWMTVTRADPATLAAFGGVPRIPTLFIYDRDGRVLAEFRRDRRRAPSRDELERLLPGPRR